MIGQVQVGTKLVCCGGRAASHLACIVCPVVGMDEDVGGHSFVSGTHAACADRACDRCRVDLHCRAIHDRNPVSDSEFLVGGTDRSVVPHAHDKAGAIQGIGRCLYEIRGRGDRGVCIERRQIDRLVTLKINDFPDTSIRFHRAHGHTERLGFGASSNRPGILNGLDSSHHPRSALRAFQVNDLIRKDISDRLRSMG